jgi:hypothetical protein
LQWPLIDNTHDHYGSIPRNNGIIISFQVSTENYMANATFRNLIVAAIFVVTAQAADAQNTTPSGKAIEAVAKLDT